METPDFIEIDILGVNKHEIDCLVLFIECNTPTPTLEERGRYIYLSDFCNLEQFLYIAHYLECDSWKWQTIAKSSEVYFYFVVWGSEAVALYESFEAGEELNDGKKKALRNCIDTYTFKSEAEKDAFCQGCADSDGWMSSEVLEEYAIKRLLNGKIY